MAVPEWVNRLRNASFVSPSGVESFFKLDTLTRIGGKKASNHEILNKNEAIPQDQGNRAIEYPLEAYFTDGNGDEEANIFFDSLGEKYTKDTPGILRHPIWGDINVMPFEWQQVHQLVGQAGIFRVPTTFRPIPQSIYPTTTGANQSEVTSDIGDLESTIEEANAGINIDLAGDYAEFSAKIRSVTKIVTDQVQVIADTVDEVSNTFRLIQDDIDRALSVGASAVEIMSQVNNLIRLPGKILTSTISKIEAYTTMAENIALSFIGFFNPDSGSQNQNNQAIMYQSLTAFVSSVTSEAALSTDFETRAAVGEAIDFINETSLSSDQVTSEIYQTLNGLFAPDHNTGLLLGQISSKSIEILINRSFDLKSKVIIILQAPSDPINMTWKYYRSTKMEDIEFFIRTNKLVDTEIMEIPTGREIVVYV